MSYPYPISFDLTNALSSEFLHLNSCGLNRGSNPPYTAYRPHGRVDWHILYQSEGELHARYGGESWILIPGDILIYEPHHPHLYSRPEGCRTWWLHFTGTAADEILTSLGLLGGIHRGPNGRGSTLIEETFRRLSGMGAPDAATRAVQNGTLLTLLGFLTRHAAGRAEDGDESLAPAIRLMREEYATAITTADCAAQCHMSESRFLHLFRERMGVSPHRFLTDIRLERARDLLAHTNLSITRVAQLCGYEDPLYFSRLFRRECGLSPRDWRK